MSDAESIRIRLGPDLKPKLETVLESHQITQQAAMVSVVRWLIEQEPLTRAMIFGQVPKTDRADLAKLVLRRLAGASKK